MAIAIVDVSVGGRDRESIKDNMGGGESGGGKQEAKGGDTRRLGMRCHHRRWQPGTPSLLREQPRQGGEAVRC